LILHLYIGNLKPHSWLKISYQLLDYWSKIRWRTRYRTKIVHSVQHHSLCTSACRVYSLYEEWALRWFDGFIRQVICSLCC